MTISAIRPFYGDRERHHRASRRRFFYRAGWSSQPATGHLRQKPSYAGLLLPLGHGGAEPMPETAAAALAAHRHHSLEVVAGVPTAPATVERSLAISTPASRAPGFAARCGV